MADLTVTEQGRRPGELTARESQLRSAFLKEIDRIPGGDRLLRCIQCGTCSGSCPVSYAMDVQPRQLVGFFRTGDIEPILRSRTIWLCASCYACTVRCPSGIKITDLLYGLKRVAMDRKVGNRRLPTYALSRTFVGLVNRYGRNQELKLVATYLLRMAPWRLFKLMPMGWSLLRKGRLPWRTHKVRAIRDLRKIIAKAEEMEQSFPREPLEPVGQIGYGAVTERTAPGRRGAA